MNKFKTTILSVMGGMDVVVNIITPLLLSLLWLYFFGIGWSTYLFIIICGVSSIFRAIKVGWLNK